MSRATVAAALTLALALALSPGPLLASDNVAPFATAPRADQLDPEEARVWAEANDLDRALRKQGYLFADPAVARYLQGIQDSLFPEFTGTMRVRVMNDTSVNAFALPNGSLYINMGLLARLENEAQIATVLAHEGGHFVARHGHQQRQNVKGASALALSLGIVGGGIGSLLGSLAAVSSVYGYSRDHEREADRISFQRLQQAGYDPRAGTKVFLILDEEAKAENFQQPVFFASHPRMQERIDSFAELAAQAPPGGEVRAADYLARTTPVRPAWLETAVGLAQHKSLILQLGKDSAAPRFGPHRGYYLGEAYRLRGEAGNDAKAEAAYRQALAEDPAFAPTYRALGLLLYRREDLPAARPTLQEYLARAPQAPDRGYIQSYLDQMGAAAVPPPHAH